MYVVCIEIFNSDGKDEYFTRIPYSDYILTFFFSPHLSGSLLKCQHSHTQMQLIYSHRTIYTYTCIQQQKKEKRFYSYV